MREIRLTLDGDMERYVWFLNGRPLWEEDTIPIRGGEVVRLIMVNRTMMHHPMHLHGHFFRVLNGQGDRAPLKHTVDVAPMSTTVIEFAAEEPGDWLFHCHLLYHMESGMARVVRYEGFDPGPVLAGARHRVHEDHWYAWGEADLLSSLTEGRLTLSRTRDIISLDWEAGWGTGEREAWDARLLWDRSFDRFLSLFAGGEYGREEGEEVRLRGVGGVRYLLPLVIESEVRLDTEGALRLALGKELPLLPRLEAFGEVAYDTREGWDGAAGLAYALGRSVAVVGRWDGTHGWGAGLRLMF